jgi:ribosomal protein S3
MRLIQRVVLSAGVAGFAVVFLIANSIFATEDALKLFGIIGVLMMLMRPERIFRHQVKAESTRAEVDVSSDTGAGPR